MAMCTNFLLPAILQRTASCTHVTARIHSRWVLNWYFASILSLLWYILNTAKTDPCKNLHKWKYLRPSVKFGIAWWPTNTIVTLCLRKLFSFLPVLGLNLHPNFHSSGITAARSPSVMSVKSSQQIQTAACSTQYWCSLKTKTLF